MQRLERAGLCSGSETGITPSAMAIMINRMLIHNRAWEPQCPHSARTMPAQCPHSARTVPAGKTQYIAREGHGRGIDILMEQITLLALDLRARDVLCFTSGHCAGTVRALNGHYAGIVRALCRAKA